MISFGFEDGFADSFDEGLGAGTAFRGLSETGRMETFFLAETEAGTGTRGTETEAGAAETFGTVGVVGTIGALGIVGIAETVEAGAGAGVTEALEIAGIVGTAGTEAGIALGMEAFSSCARLNKNSK
jgi:hypothetical protein